MSNIKPSQLKHPKCTGKAEKANCLGYLLGHTDRVTVKSSTVKLMLPLRNICLTLLTCAKCGVRSTLCWKIPNISGSIELFAL